MLEEGHGRYQANQATDGAWWKAQVVNFVSATSVRLSICYTVYSLFSIRSLIKLRALDQNVGTAGQIPFSLIVYLKTFEFTP